MITIFIYHPFSCKTSRILAHGSDKVKNRRFIFGWQIPQRNLNSMKDEKVCRQLIYRTIRRYKDTGSVQDRARTGRPTSVCTQQLICYMDKLEEFVLSLAYQTDNCLA